MAHEFFRKWSKNKIMPALGWSAFGGEVGQMTLRNGRGLPVLRRDYLPSVFDRRFFGPVWPFGLGSYLPAYDIADLIDMLIDDIEPLVCRAHRSVDIGASLCAECATYTVEISVCGYELGDVARISGGYLVIEDEDGNPICRMCLPYDVDLDRTVEAKLEDGILIIVIPVDLHELEDEDEEDIEIYIESVDEEAADNDGEDNLEECPEDELE